MTPSVVRTLRSPTSSNLTDSFGKRTRIAIIVSLQFPVQVRDEYQRQTRWIRFAIMYRAVPRGAPRKNHLWGTRHSVEPIRGVESAGRGESVAGVRRRCDFGEARALAW